MSWIGDRFRLRRSVDATGDGAAPAMPEDALRRLRLEASQVADGVMSGFHASARLGRGIEFAGFRNYVPGDDLRFLDRRRSLSDTGLLIRQYEVERDRALLVIVDGSASMAASGDDAPGRTRQWADVVAAALVRIAAAQGDGACAAVDGPSGAVGGFFRGKKAFERATEVLVHRHGASDHGRVRDVLVAAVSRVASASGWVVFVGDFLDEAMPLFPVLAEARARGAHVAVVRIETPAERDFPFEGAVHLRDPESGDRVETFGPAARARYLAAREKHRDAATRRLNEAGVHVVDAWTDGRVEEVLARTLEGLRQRVSHRG